MLDENVGTVGQVTSHDTPTNIQDRYIQSYTKGLLNFQKYNMASFQVDIHQLTNIKQKYEGFFIWVKNKENIVVFKLSIMVISFLVSADEIRKSLRDTAIRKINF